MKTYDVNNIFSFFSPIKITQEVKCIQVSKERQRIFKACHVALTSGHMGVKRTNQLSYHRTILLEGINKDVRRLYVYCSTVELLDVYMYISEFCSSNVHSSWL